MKKLFLSGCLLLSALAYSQDTIKPQRFYLGVGPSVGFGGLGGNLHLSYALNKKFNVKIRAVLNDKKQQIYTNSDLERSLVYDVSFSANYFIIGNTRVNNRFNLFLGFGLGYFNGTQNDYGLISGYVDKFVGQGFAVGTNIGASVKLGPGRLYAEGYLSIALLGSHTDTNRTTYYTGYSFPPNVQTRITRDYAGPFGGILCLNVGYAIPF